MRYCKDCRHFEGGPGGGLMWPEPYCRHPQSVRRWQDEDLIWGVTQHEEWKTCQKMRTHKVGACGVHGELWEPREQEA